MPDTAGIRGAVEEFRRRHDIPGISLCTFTSAGPALTVATGHASVRSGAQPVTPKTRFRIYSITKMMTGTVAAALAADGAVDLDAPVDYYLPELAAWNRQSRRSVTLRLLLSHQAGLPPDALTRRAMSRDADGLRAAVLHDVPRLPRLAEPGQVYSYSSIAISLAGFVLERATGMRFRSLIRDRLLEPLGMAITTHDPEEAMSGPHAQHHLTTAGGRLRVAHDARLGIRYETSSLCYSTPADIARFGAAHLGGAHQVVPEAALAQLRHRHADLRLDVDMSYGLTCYRTRLQDGRLLFGHEGFFAGMWAKLIIDPERDFGVVWMDNRGDELREQRYALLTRLFGVPGQTACGLGATSAQADAVEVEGRYERAADDGLQVRPLGDGLGVTDGDRCVSLDQDHPGLWVSRYRLGPGEAPWGPHAGSQRICLSLTRSAAGGVSFVHLNGLPYRRVTAA